MKLQQFKNEIIYFRLCYYDWKYRRNHETLFTPINDGDGDSTNVLILINRQGAPWLVGICSSTRVTPFSGSDDAAGVSVREALQLGAPKYWSRP